GELRLPLEPKAANSTSADAQVLVEYVRARQLLDGPRRAEGVALLRSLLSKSPEYAPAHAALARTFATNLRVDPLNPQELHAAPDESALALKLDPNLAETQIAAAILACRAADWATCMDSFQRALELDPVDTDGRITYALWLAGLGYVDKALHQ